MKKYAIFSALTCAMILILCGSVSAADAPKINTSLPGGTYNTTQTVTLTADVSEATIYYANDTTDPRTSETSITYTGPITISKTTTLRYAAVDTLGNWSQLYLQNYVIGKGGLADSSWPTFMGNNNRTGLSNVTAAQTNNVLWNTTIASGVDTTCYSSPIIGSDGTIYFGRSSGIFYAYNPDGTLKWFYTIGSAIQGSAAIGKDGTLYIGSDSGIFYALNPDGTLKWFYTTGGRIRGSASIGADGTIYFGSRDENLYALNPDGTLKWNYTTSNYFTWSTPAIGADGTIYIPNYDIFYAINPDGTLKWTYGTTGAGVNGQTSTIGDDGTIYLMIGTILNAFNPDGTLKWSCNTGYASAVTTSPGISPDGTIYVVSQTRYLTAVNPDGTLKWQIGPNGNFRGSPAIGADGTLYVTNTNQSIRAIDSNGTIIWMVIAGATSNSVAIGADGTVYVVSGSNILYAFKDLTPVADFTATPTNGITPQTVQFTDASSNAGSWAWDFDNDGVIDSTEKNPTHIYDKAGTYTVKLTVTNASGTDEEVKTAYITVVTDITAPVPSADLVSGSYNTDQTVNLNAVDDLDANPKIYYTLDGSDPTTSSTLYTGPISINTEGTTILKFIAVDGSGNISGVIERTYIIDKTAPTASADPVGGTSNSAQNVSLTANDTNTTTIYYTTDGSDPLSSSTKIEYTGPIVLKATTTLRFTAVDAAGNWSPDYSETYNIIDIAAPVASADIDDGLYNTDKTVTLSAVDDLDANPKIYYTLDGSDPTTSSTLYTGPITISSEGTTVLRFIAVDASGNISDIFERTYTIDKTAPTAFADVDSGSYNTSRMVNLSKSEDGAIYYTTDGSTPTTSSTLYGGPINVDTSMVLKFIVVDLAGNQSGVYTRTYTIDKVAPAVIEIDPAKSAVVKTVKVIKVTFSEVVKDGSLWINFKNGSGKAVQFATSFSGNTLIIIPKITLISGKYSLGLHTGAFTDLAGNKLSVYSSSFIVDSTAPTISKIDPANGSTNVAASKTIKVTFNENIKAGSNFWIELKNSNGKAISFTSSISGKVLTITPKIKLAESKYTLAIHTGSVTDLAGNPVALKSSKFSVGTSPTVAKTDPKNVATKVARNKTIKVTFNENIKAGSNYWIELKTNNGKSVKITKSISGKVLTITQTAKLAANTKYKLVLHTGSVTDLAGNPVALKSFTFTTGTT